MRLPVRTCTIAALAIGLASAPASAQKTLSFASVPQGSFLNLVTTITAKMLLDRTDLKLSVAPMRGPEAVIVSIDKGRAEFAYADVSEVAAAIDGDEYFKGRPVKNVRAVAKIVTLPVGFIVSKDSPIKSLADLKGKRVPVGWKSFRQGLVLLKASLAAGGLTLEDVRGVPTIGLISAAEDFKAGKVDAGYIAPTAPKIREIDAALGGIRFLGSGHGPEQLEAVRSIRKDFHIVLVKPAPHITGIVEPTYLVAFDNAVVAGTHVPDEVVYKLTKALNENKADLVKGHPMFRGFFPKQAAKKFSVLKYHPGAIRYYKEVGIWKD